MENAGGPRVFMEGILEKVSKSPRSTKVWCVLTDSSLMIFKENKRSSCIASVEMEEIQSVRRLPDKKEQFEISTIHNRNKSLLFIAASESECSKWMELIHQLANTNELKSESCDSRNGCLINSGKTTANKENTTATETHGSFVNEPVVRRRQVFERAYTIPRSGSSSESPRSGQIKSSQPNQMEAVNTSQGRSSASTSAITSNGLPTSVTENIVKEVPVSTPKEDVPDVEEPVVMRKSRFGRSSTCSESFSSFRDPAGSGIYDTLGPPEIRASVEPDPEVEYSTIDDMLNHTPEVNGAIEDENIYDDILSSAQDRSISPLPYGPVTTEELEPLNELKKCLRDSFGIINHHVSWTENTVEELKEFISSLGTA